MLQKTKKIVEKIESTSSFPIENKKALETYVLESLNNNRVVTFFNWECPPRFLATVNSKTFINYNVDLREIFKGNKVDTYTELPRVVEKANDEKKFLKFLNNLGLRYRFIKIIADTNAYYLTPETIKILGEKKIREKFTEFKKLIKQEVKNYPTKVEVFLFTDLMKAYRKDYNAIYKLSYKILTKNPGNLLKKSVFNQQLKRTKEHMGMTDNKQTKEFTIRTIATYAAEGIVFDILSKTSYFSNCIWLNNHEIDQRTIEITNCYRKKIGLNNLPMIFPS